MSSKFDRLRAGEVVDIEPGRKGRLNLQEKTFETSDGRTVYVGDDEDFFPSSEHNLALSKEKENLEKDIARIPGGEFIHQFGQQGIVGGAKDWTSRLLRSGEDYLRNKQAEAEVSEKISKRSPYTSGAAKLASFVPDIALTRGMSALKAAPLISGLSAGSRALDEPAQVAGEAALAAGGGFLLDKAGGFLNRVAQRRGASRAIPAQQAEIRAQNALGKQQVENANLQQKQKFNALEERTKNENAALLHQHNLAVNDRENRMIQAQNSFGESSEQYKLAKKEYDNTVKSLPKLQKEAQEEYSKNVINSSKKIEKLFPKDSKIHVSQIAPDEFIEQSIRLSGLTGSREGNQAARVIKSLFHEGETLSARELSKRYQAIEEAIQRANPEVQQVLIQFKNHLGERLPTILQDSISHGKIIPLLQRNLEKDVNSILSTIKGMDASATANIRSSAKSAISAIDSNDFINRLQNGQITQQLIDNISKIENFIPGVKPADAQQILNLNSKNPFKKASQGLIKTAQDRQQQFISQLEQKMNNNIANYEIKAMKSASQAAEKIGKNVKGTYGIAEPVSLPTMPNPPNPPQTLPIPQKPSLNPNPASPIPQSFSPQSEPVLAPAQTGSERVGDFLEKNLLGGKSLVNNPLTKLAGLKYLFGKAALPAEAAYLGLKGLTSPTAGGEIARLSFKQAGMQAIEQLAQKYPSYHDGIIENPQERRSLTKEIEEDSEIPLEEKALIQSKINRGKPLQQPIS